MKKWIRDRVWFGWYWASFCSRHSVSDYRPDCEQCKRGQWGRDLTLRYIVGLKAVWHDGHIVRWER